jgi:site-specific DNA-cytosine methylase
MWFVKSKRAQTSDDDETWVAGGVAPTLNAFDMGDTRATVIILMREREGKSGGGKGFLLSDDKAFTLATSNFHTIFMFSHNHGLDPQASEEASPTLRSGGNGMAVAFPLDLRNATRDADKLDEQNRQGLGVGNEGDPSPTITNAFVPGVVAVDTYNQTLSSINQTLRKGNAGIDHTGGVIESSVVRRLTPTECERLQGFPDGWTDGQADSHRYKQMGNAVAVPVVQWIIDRLVK